MEKLKEIDPDVRAIVSSGYSNDPVMADYRDYGFLNVVAKPYKVENLGKTVSEVIRHGSQHQLTRSESTWNRVVSRNVTKPVSCWRI